jgi:CBS domain containing-hemolysin-like protein
MLILVFTVLGSLAISFLCSIAEAVVLSVQHAQIEALGKSRAAEILRQFKREIDIPIAAIVSFHTVAHTIGASVCGAMYVHAMGDSSLWVFSLTFTLAVLLFSEIIPKTIGVTYVSTLAAPVAYGVTGLAFVLKPVLWVTSKVSHIVRGDHESSVTSLEEIRLLVALGRTEGALAGRVADMIEGATALRELTAYDVMVPRAQVAFLSGERTLQENLDLMRRSQHSRFPYTPDADLDHAKGVILVKDLLFRDGALTNGADLDFEAVQSPLLVVPAAAPLEKVLRTFQEERRHIAIVVDEYGGTQGLITLEDVLEEIVGEIDDEHDDAVDPSAQIAAQADGQFIVDALTPIDDFNERFGADFPDDDYDTVGGLVTDAIGHLPESGEELAMGRFHFRVARADARRVHALIVSVQTDV